MGDPDEGDADGRRMLLVTTDHWSVSCQIAPSGAAAAGAAVVSFNGGRSRPGMAAAKTATSGSSGNRFASHEVSFFRSSSVISYIAIRSASVKFYNDRRGVFNELETLLSWKSEAKRTSHSAWTYRSHEVRQLVEDVLFDSAI